MKKVRLQFMIVTLSIVGLSRLLSGSDVTVQFGEADTTEFAKAVSDEFSRKSLLASNSP